MATKTITNRGPLALDASPTVNTITLAANNNHYTSITITAVTNTGTVYLTVDGSTPSATTSDGNTNENYVIPPVVGYRLRIPLGYGNSVIKLLASAATTIHVELA
jgi:hypothetical protein